MNSPYSTDTETRHGRLSTRYKCTRRTWWVSVTAYNHRGKRFSAAHFIAAVLQKGGQEAAIKAARALRIFGVWNDRAVQKTGDEGKVIESIAEPLQGRNIINAIWPHSVEGTKEALLAWAKRIDDSLEDWEDAHDTLLRQCLGRDLCICQRSEEWDTERWLSEANSSITEDHFRNVIAPLIQAHFSANVDLESLWHLVLTGPWPGVDRKSTRASFAAAYQDTPPNEGNEISGSGMNLRSSNFERTAPRSPREHLDLISTVAGSLHPTQSGSLGERNSKPYNFLDEARKSGALIPASRTQLNSHSDSVSHTPAIAAAPPASVKNGAGAGTAFYSNPRSTGTGTVTLSIPASIQTPVPVAPALKASVLLEEMYQKSQHKTIEGIQAFMASKQLKTAHLWQQIVDRRVEEAKAVADELAKLDDM